jgi:hypothetical protein
LRVGWGWDGWERLGQSGGERRVREVGERWEIPRCTPLLECVVCSGWGR